MGPGAGGRADDRRDLAAQARDHRGALTSVELEMRTWRGELALAQPLAQAGAQLPRNMASLHAWALAGYQSARGEADAARTTLVPRPRRRARRYTSDCC